MRQVPGKKDQTPAVAGMPRNIFQRALLLPALATAFVACGGPGGDSSITGRRADDFFAAPFSCLNCRSPQLTQKNTVKLRILNNSIRLRLTRPEVDEAAASGIVRGSVTFPDGASFGYVLEGSPASVSANAAFSEGVLTVSLPQSAVQAWAESADVSIVSEQWLEDGSKLDILVEKDFACLAPRPDEDESAMFPHPRSGEQNC